MFYLFFFLVWLFYYIAKGVIPTQKIPKLILIVISVGLWLLLYYFAQNFHQTAKLIGLFYLILSGATYIFIINGFRPLTFKLFSGLFLTADEVKISYFIFKPLILLPINLFLLFKKFPALGFRDSIEVSVKPKNCS